MHPLEKFKYCPVCGDTHFDVYTEKSKRCRKCGFEYFLNPSTAVVAFILNEKGEILIEKRKMEPAKGTADLPGGFSDLNETAEESVIREVKEETNLDVTETKYLFSLPNIYLYSGFEIHTLDMFFICRVRELSDIKALDDAAECRWVKPTDINIEDFGLKSIRKGLQKFLDIKLKGDLQTLPFINKKEK